MEKWREIEKERRALRWKRRGRRRESQEKKEGRRGGEAKVQKNRIDVKKEKSEQKGKDGK